MATSSSSSYKSAIDQHLLDELQALRQYASQNNAKYSSGAKSSSGSMNAYNPQVASGWTNQVLSSTGLTNWAYTTTGTVAAINSPLTAVFNRREEGVSARHISPSGLLRNIKGLQFKISELRGKA